jgi:GntR family transcriptional repressor for pyruvate dehydrogenase complex
MHVRQMMEPQIASLAAKNRSAEDLAFLEKNLARFKDRTQDSSILAQLDLEFHSKIIEACGNPIIKVILEPVYSQLPKVKTLIVKHVKTVSDTAHIYHENIFEMIKQQNERGAFDAMTVHLQVAERDVLALYQSLEKFKSMEVAKISAF